MSCLLSFVALAGPTRPDAAAVMAGIVDRLRARGFIVGPDDPDAILAGPGGPGGPVYRPGPAAEVPGFAPLARSSVNGAELRAGLTINWGPLIWPEDLQCPRCGWRPMDKPAPGYDAPAGNRAVDAIGKNAAAGNFADDAAPCGRCGAALGSTTGPVRRLHHRRQRAGSVVLDPEGQRAGPDPGHLCAGRARTPGPRGRLQDMKGKP